jgi:hypothetical protein
LGNQVPSVCCRIIFHHLITQIKPAKLEIGLDKLGFGGVEKICTFADSMRRRAWEKDETSIDEMGLKRQQDIAEDNGNGNWIDGHHKEGLGH